MHFHDENGISQLKFLENEVAKLTARDPELKSKHQQVRAAYVVAEALSDLLERSGLSLQEAATVSDITEDVVEAALSASIDRPATLETVATIAQAAGFRFELQLIPDSWFLKQPNSGNVEASEDGVPDGILIRFPFPFVRRTASSSLHKGMQRTLRKTSENFHSNENIPSRLGTAIEMWQIVEFAEQRTYKLQLRFRFRGLNTSMQLAAQDKLPEYHPLFSKIFMKTGDWLDGEGNHSGRLFTTVGA